MAEAPTEVNEAPKDETKEDSSQEEKQSKQSQSSPRKEYQRSRTGGTQQRRPYQPRNRRYHRRKVCAFCVDKTLVISWKKTENLRRFVADSGAIQPRRKSGVCARHQRRVAVAIKRARHLALFPYTNEHARIMSKG